MGLAQGPINMIVTNVPGPQFPLYSVGAPLLGMYPVVPLIPGGGLGIALFSYEGKLCWGFNADYELVPDLHTFVADLRAAFEELRKATVARFMERRTARPETASSEEAKPRGKKRSKDSRADVRKAPASDAEVPRLVPATAGRRKVRGKGRTSSGARSARGG